MNHFNPHISFNSMNGALLTIALKALAFIAIVPFVSYLANYLTVVVGITTLFINYHKIRDRVKEVWPSIKAFFNKYFTKKNK